MIFANNQFQSVVPDSWGRGRDLPNLTHIDVHSNHLYGYISTTLVLLKQLTYLDLSSNQLTGALPTGWQSGPNLLANTATLQGYFNISNNYFWGSPWSSPHLGTSPSPPTQRAWNALTASQMRWASEQGPHAQPSATRQLAAAARA